MSNQEKKCNAIFKDPFFNGSICNKKAKYMIKIEGEENYIHPRCGTHSKKEDKIELYPKNKKNINDKNKEKVNDKNIFNLDELLKYIEDEDNEIDRLNDNIEKLLIIS